MGKRKTQILHTRFRTKCSNLNNDRLKEITHSPLCRCGIVESSYHYLLCCSFYKAQKKNLFAAVSITKTCLYNFAPHKPHFYIVKLGLTGYTLFFLFLLKNIDCEYSLEPPRRGGSNEYPQSMILSRKMKNIRFFLSENFQFYVVNFSVY